MQIEVHLVRFEGPRLGFTVTSRKYVKLYDSDGQRILGNRVKYRRLKRIGRLRDGNDTSMEIIHKWKQDGLLYSS